MTKKNKGGRPRAFKTDKELKEKIDGYFDSITLDQPRVMKKIIGFEDEEKQIPIYEEVPVLDNRGNQVIETIWYEHPTIGGLCAYLDIVRNTLWEYEQMDEYKDTVKKAKNRIERYLENELYRTQGHTGLIFNLKNNFKWVDKHEVDQSVNAKVEAEVKQSINLSKLSVEELKQLETIIDKTSDEETD